MKKIILVSFILLATVLSAKSTIKFKNLVFDFGQEDAGKILNLLFEFENAGSDLLIIKNVIPSCGCTAAELKKREYKPGEKGTIDAKFNTSGYNGQIVKTITVTSNDPDSPEIRLTIRGTLALKDFAQADLKPSIIPFGTVSAGKTYVRKLNLSNPGTLNLRIIEISHGPEVTLEFKTNSLAPKNSTEITLQFTPFEKGTFNNMVKIRTNDYRTPYIFVRLEAQVE